MSQIDRKMRALGSYAVASPLHGATLRHRHEPWNAQALHSALSRIVDAILTWRERAQMRRRLLSLDDRMLKDIGITRAEAHGEAEKPFWQV
jgi:uncharacterized protein YjiS (DUF1127 family)